MTAVPRLPLALLLLPALVLAGCSLFKDDKPRLKGERISVLSLDKKLVPDPALAQLEIRLPKPVANHDWPDAGGYPNHAMQHVALGDAPAQRWEASIGDGSSRYTHVLAPPVVAGDRLFSLDADYLVRAFDRRNGDRLWEVAAKPEDSGAAVGGGLAYAGGSVFVTTGYAQILALDAKTGREIWRQSALAPFRGPPTVADGRVFAVTVDNELNVFAADDGRRLWTQSGTAESAGLAGGGSPAVDGDVVVVPYSSGELFALRVENGRQLWTESLAAPASADALSALADIRGGPVIDRGRVFAVSHSGRMVAIDLRTGARTWEQDIGGTEMPWVAGDYVYVITNDNNLVCLMRDDGRVRWVAELARYEDATARSGPLTWVGPVLAGDRLIVLASNGEAMSYSPYTGRPLGHIKLPDGTFLRPIVADRTLYVLTDDAELIAMK